MSKTIVIAAAMQGRQNPLAGLKVPKIRPVALSLQPTTSFIAPPALQRQTITGGAFVSEQGRDRANQRKVTSGSAPFAPAKIPAKRIGVVVESAGTPTPKRHRIKPTQPLQASDSAVSAAETYPVRLLAKEHARKNWESLHITPKPLCPPAPSDILARPCTPSTAPCAQAAQSAAAAPKLPAAGSPNQAKDASRSSPVSRKSAIPGARAAG